MSLFVLTETAAGYALHKAKDKKLLSHEDIAEQLSSADKAAGILRLKKFEKFPDAATATEEASGIVEGKVTPILSKLLEDIKEERKASLAVADPKLANAITKIPGLKIQPIADSSTEEVYRAIRQYMTSLIPGLLDDDMKVMSLGLSHSLSRHKLKFSPDKVDVMIIQAISLLDDLDKEINTYSMRVREWYGWHFPEMAKMINDNLAYARVITKMGMRTNAKDTDLDDILPDEISIAVKAAAEVSMGSEITSQDLDTISSLATQVVEFTEYRRELSAYLTTRMQAIAPNLTVLVGELVGARLISHAGSLINLAKSPASTIQILGAEKALFRALKTKSKTPKYGLIYHASLVGKATGGKNKGKVARMLAAKTALGLRMDALMDWGTEGEGQGEEPTDEEKTAKSNIDRMKIERKLRILEGLPVYTKGNNAIAPVQEQPVKFEIKEARKYNPAADGLAETSEPIAVASAKAGKLIEEVPAHASDASMADDEPASTNGTLNGEREGRSKRKRDETNEDRVARKAAKAERKAERAAKRAAKAAKKAQKSIKEVEPAEDDSADSEEDKAAKKAAKRERKEAKKAEKLAKKEKRKREGDESKREKKKVKKEEA